MKGKYSDRKVLKLLYRSLDGDLKDKDQNKLDETLKKRESHFRTPVLACAVGIYLPIELSVPIFAGGLVAHLVERYFQPGDSEGERERIHQKGTLFAAGLITGEALMGIFMAVPIVAIGSASVLALPEKYHFGGWLGLAMLTAVAVLLYRLAVRQDSVKDQPK